MQNLIDPAILFFVFGVLAGAVRSNLEVPPALAKFFSLYLLVSLGLKGGANLAASGLPAAGALALGAALLMAALVPTYGFLILRRRTNPFDAAAIAATYGSVSAVTFIAAQQYLTQQGVAFGGYMTVAMVLMESPAIVMAVLLASYVRRRSAAPGEPAPSAALSMRKVLHEAFTDGAHLLLIGSLVIGFVTGDRGKQIMAPFAVDIFKGILAFFLLEMGLLVARQLRESQVRLERHLLAFALLMPVANAAVALALAAGLGLARGDAVLLAVLSASASYIVVPAIVRYAIPEARPGVYFTMSLACTFPFNILAGIPLYHAASGWLWS
ncbi:MAG: sodium-dependent bicarbonate transport family permease [Burkholderiales bacterium]|nr:sodium-dependent bicarbonate transport family permease [Burkholderiales bacterium]